MDRRVERLQRRCVAEPGILSLAGGLPARETFPLAGLAAAFGQLGGDALQYDWPEGRPGLRAWIAKRLARRGARVSPEDVLVTSGAQQALDIAIRLALGKGRRVRVPEACYPGALELFEAYGCTLDAENEAVDLEYVMPVVANPTGLPLSDSERTALLARSHWVLEDDAYAELCFEGDIPPSLLATAPERVLHVGTLSKTLCPGLRIGWLVVPSRLREAARGAKQRSDLQGNTLAQSIVERYVEQEDFDERLRSLRAFYAQRADALVQALARELPSWHFEAPRGGFSLWLTVSEAWDEVELLRTAMAHGTSFDPGRDFRPHAAKGSLGLRLAFSSLPASDIDEAVVRLARAFRTYAASPRVNGA